MIVYHGSNVVVEQPRLLNPNRYLDFGKGFYTTSNMEQAYSFAEKVKNRQKSGQSTVNQYYLDDQIFTTLKVLSFERPDEGWLDYVSNNRNGIEVSDEFDLVTGPVADDDIYQTFLLYSSGVITKAQTLEALRVKKTYNQIVFKTDEALSFLKFEKTLVGKEK